ncbi:AMSH-like ubiquitin thioesterase 3 isoform X2 [Magnolia sinica]|uniref:AMSH-like ubiquitin thioesterase 3 isoform X2 n=1 Tax=Magnolia sinica TaxID=86752 RepID=UPI00265B549D|nr:AMSH-like ubiquitin thioesterase 3 isoform X2 [Magnolia sinica]
MGSPSGAFSISAFVQKDDVDNRIALRIYYMIADCFLRQADSYREEKNIILLFIMLMKFSSLMSETIPCHRDYLVSLKRERLSFEKKLLNALTELETLKPTVESLIEEQNRKHMKKVAEADQVQYPSNLDLTAVDEMPTPAEMPRFLPVPRHCFLDPTIGLRDQWQPPSTDSGVQYPSNLDLTLVDEMPTPAEMPRFLPVPRHCFLDPTIGLRDQWQPPSTDSGVQYPSNLDLTLVDEMPTPAEMPRFLPVPRHCFLDPTIGLCDQWQPPSTDSGV